MTQSNRTGDGADRQAALHRLQAETFSLQSDKSRLERKRNDCINEVRRMQTDLGHLKAALDEKMAAERSLTREVELVDEELMRVKKQINSLR